MKLGEECENLRSTGMEGRTCGSNGADGKQIEHGHDGSKNRKRKEIEAFDAAIFVRHLHFFEFRLKLLLLQR